MVLDQALVNVPMNVPVNAVLFDFDGTLFHLPVDWPGLRRSLGVADGEQIGPLLHAFMAAGDAERLAVVTRYEVDAAARGSFLPGAPACLRRLPGVHVAIVTRNSRHAVLAALGEAAPLNDAGPVDGRPVEVPVVIGREDVQRLKPAPDGVLTALAQLGATAAGALLVGDTYHDVEAARAAGVRSVIVRNPRLAYSPAGANAYLDDLRDLPAVLTTGRDAVERQRAR